MSGLAVAAGLLALTTGVAWGKDGVSSSEPQRPAPPTGALDLSIRARALGLQSDAPAPVPPSLEFEAEHAPTGAGTTRWPSRTELGKGVYIEVLPTCIPGVDEPLLPPLRPRPPRH